MDELEELFREPLIRASLKRMQQKFKHCYYPQTKFVQEDWEYIDQAEVFLREQKYLNLVVPSPFSLQCEDEAKDCKKDKYLSYIRREFGNKAYKRHEWKKAIDCYTQAIAFAPPGSEQLAFAYANRSAALYESGFYEECLGDLERALSTIDYPANKKEKLLNRQQNATEKLPLTRKVVYHEPVPTIENKHPSIPSAADCVKICQNEQYGRFIEATRDIQPGEIICVEKPYAVAVENSSRYLYCTFCTELCLNLIPCEGCVFSVYCSETCKQQAFEEYHKYECVIMEYYPTHFTKDDPWAQMGLKVNLKGLKEYKNLQNEDTSIYRSDRYKEISEFPCHMDKLQKHVIFEMALPLARIYNIIKSKTKLIQECEIDDKAFKTMLVRNKVIQAINYMAVKSYDIPKESSIDERAVGLWAFFGLFNHSCVDNVRWCFYGSTIVTRAIRKIKKGSQLFVSLCASYLDLPKDIRQQAIWLTQLFNCTCKACTENWPTEKELDRDTTNRPINLRVYTKLGFMAVDCLNRRPILKNRREKILKQVFKLAARIEDEEPSISFGLLNALYQKLMLVGNTEFKM